MRASAAQIEITPPVGVELSGFVAREQPSTGIHDPLYARALYLDDESGGKLLWLHADVIGFEGAFSDSVRERIASAFDLRPEQVILSATHTHSGPPTIRLNNCGERRPADEWDGSLRESLFEVAVQVLRSPRPAQLTLGHSSCGINHDRRGFASAHVDRRCSAIGVRHGDGDYLAVLANYPCHPVALGGRNRLISGDLFGFAAAHVSNSLPGRPVALFTNGACGNLNPPDVGVGFPECEQLGVGLGTAALAAVRGAEDLDGPIQVAADRFEVEAEPLTKEGVESRAESVSREIEAWNNEWVRRAQAAVESWKRSMIDMPSAHAPIDLRLHAVRIGALKVACFGAECFSIMGDLLRSRCGDPLFVVGYANGEVGYLCPAPTYDEGGYEVSSAFIYYNAPPIKQGEFERASQRMASLLASLSDR